MGGGEMQDKYGRIIDYMRISITDRCNLRCRYCMPEGIPGIPGEEILTYEEIIRVCSQAAALGISNYKITGGEPLVREECYQLVEGLKQIPGVRQVTMTTNGVLLQEALPRFLTSGLDGINISLDTVNPALYRQITGFDKLSRVLLAIEAAAAGALRVKINVVLQKNVNLGEWQALAELAQAYPVDVRFIELMPIGSGKNQEAVSNHWLLAQMRQQYPGISFDASVHGNGPAVYYRIPGFQGAIGFISAIHGKFCQSCNRIRLTAAGELKPCLCYKDTVSLREAARAGEDDKIRALLEKAVAIKPGMHCFEELSQVTEEHKMVQIGG